MSNQIQVIRSEIERRSNLTSDTTTGRELDEILSFIDAFQVDEPEEDIDEKIAREFFGRNFMDDHGRLSVQLSIDEFKTLLHHFYELGQQKTITIEPKDVDEAAEKFASKEVEKSMKMSDEDIEALGAKGIGAWQLVDAFKAGAEWKELQMLEERVGWNPDFLKDIDEAEKPWIEAELWAEEHKDKVSNLNSAKFGYAYGYHARDKQLKNKENENTI